MTEVRPCRFGVNTCMCCWCEIPCNNGLNCFECNAEEKAVHNIYLCTGFIGIPPWKRRAEMASEKRLIDADRALKIVYEQAAERPVAYYLFDYAALILQEAPTVDAVEVVRCRNCIGRSTWYNDAKYGCAICGMSGMYPKSEDGFCSYGIRKDGGEND